MYHRTAITYLCIIIMCIYGLIKYCYRTEYFCDECVVTDVIKFNNSCSCGYNCMQPNFEFRYIGFTSLSSHKTYYILSNDNNILSTTPIGFFDYKYECKDQYQFNIGYKTQCSVINQTKLSLLCQYDYENSIIIIILLLIISVSILTFISFFVAYLCYDIANANIKADLRKKGIFTSEV